MENYILKEENRSERKRASERQSAVYQTVDIRDKKMSGHDLKLPPGFRFHPTDEELVTHYLCRKCASMSISVPIIAEIDLYKFDPWQLPGMYSLVSTVIIFSSKACLILNFPIFNWSMSLLCLLIV